MLLPGSIYFIKNFEYVDGGQPSDKLLIVLFLDEEDSIIIKALPTSQQRVPVSINNHGCTNNDLFSFFMFQEKRIVGTKVDGSNFSFDKNTFVLVKDNVSIINRDALLKYFPGRINHLANLSEDEYKRLIKCIKASVHLKQKVKRVLNKLSA
jgi:hypothetical protein